MRQQRLGTTGPLFDPLVTALGEDAIAGKVGIALRLGQIADFLACRVGQVEWNITGFHMTAVPALQMSIVSIEAAPNWLFSPTESTVYPDVARQTKLFPCGRPLSTSFRRAGSPLAMPKRFRP